MTFQTGAVCFRDNRVSFQFLVDVLLSAAQNYKDNCRFCCAQKDQGGTSEIPGIAALRIQVIPDTTA